MRTYICLFAMAASAGAMLGQEVGVVSHAQIRVMPRGDEEKVRHAQEMGFASIIGAEVIPGKPVTGAPYTADTVTEFTQVLADGTRIHNSTSGMIARDSAGRTRREQSVAGFGAAALAEKLAMIVITDPVAGFSYTLNTREKVATRIPFPKIETGADAIQVMHVEAMAAGGGAVNVKLRHPDSEPRKESLGTKVIEGVQAEGTRIVHLIPAGAMGNDRPLEVVAERWFSPQLQTVVLTRHSDPRSGENTFRLMNVVRSEPSPTLFEVPPDYTVKEGPRQFIKMQKVQPRQEE